MADQSPAPRAERPAQSEFALTNCRARQKQVRNVHTRYQEQEADGRQENHQLCADVPNHGFLQRCQPDPLVSVRVGIKLCQADCDAVHLSAGLVNSDAGLQTSDDLKGVVASVPCAPRIVGNERYPNLRVDVGKVKICGNDTDDRVGFFIQTDGLMDELRIPVEQAVPQAFSDQRDAIVAGLVLACQERAAKKWLHAHYVKIIHGNKRARYALGATLSCEVEAAAEVSGHAGE